MPIDDVWLNADSFDPATFDTGPELPPLPTLRPLPPFRALVGWPAPPDQVTTDPNTVIVPAGVIGSAARIETTAGTEAAVRIESAARVEQAAEVQPPTEVRQPMETQPGGGQVASRADNRGQSDAQRVLVLGGSGTVGSAIVRALAATGARVAVHHASRVADAAALVGALPGDGQLAVTADLADSDAVGELVRSVDATFDGLDVVINAASAAESARPRSVVGSTLADWTDAWTGTLTVDVLGAATAAHAAAAAFVARARGGRIILLAAKGRPWCGRSAVALATEQAVAALGAALAAELAPHGIGVTVVGSGSAAAAGWSPEALAETVAWLASGPSSAQAGAVFNIAG